MTACYLINRTPTKVLQDVSPFEVLNKTKLSLDHLRVFGCVCFVLVSGDQRNKLDAKSTRCMFIGYSTTQKRYKCYDPINQRLYVSRDVKFFEERGYYEKKDWNSLADLSTPSTDRATSLQFLLDHLGVTPSSEREIKTRDLVEEPVVLDQDHEQEETPNLQQDGDVSGIPTYDDVDILTQHEDVSAQELTDQHTTTIQSELPRQATSTLRRSTRIKRKSSRLYYNNKAVAHPIQAVCSLALLPQDHQAFLGKIEENFVPQTYEEAKESEEWMIAVADETGAMIRNHTWDEEELPQRKSAVSSKWVFRIKYLSNCEIERHKARL